MRHYYYFILLCMGLCVGLLGCGPKVVGGDTPVTPPSGTGYANADPGHLRYPMSGRNVDKKLYLMNSPQFMRQYQTYHTNFLQQQIQKNGNTDYTNLQPQQVSPFRE